MKNLSKYIPAFIAMCLLLAFAGNHAHAVVTLPSAVTSLDLGEYITAMMTWVLEAVAAVLLAVVSYIAIKSGIKWLRSAT